MRRGRGAAVLLAWGVVALAAPSASEPLAVSTRPVALDPEDPSRVTVGALTYRGGLDLRSRDRRFGGLSALSIARSGRRLLALTDKGYRVDLTVTYDTGGNLSGIGEAHITALGDLVSGSIAGSTRGDAESIASFRGGYAIGFEVAARLWLYRGDGEARFGKPMIIPPPPGLRAAPANEGIEALATLADGRLFALTEGFAAGSGLVRGWVSAGNAWRPLGYRLAGRFVPTGAAAMAGGDVLVLERRFTWVGGFASRIVRVKGGGIRAGAVLHGAEIALIDAPLTVDNFEGIAVRPRAGGGAYIYLISDDNFIALQRTLRMMFEYAG